MAETPRDVFEALLGEWNYLGDNKTDLTPWRKRWDKALIVPSAAAFQETPRTWPVIVREDGKIESWGLTHPTPRNFGQIEVIEKAPVDRLLDLLERVCADYAALQSQHSTVPASEALSDAEELLRTQGRLSEEEKT